MSVDQADVRPAEPSSPVVVVQRWKRYGHDRAYVNVDGQGVGGQGLGYRDLRTGAVHCDESHVELVSRATADLYARVRPLQDDYSPRHAAPDQPPPSAPSVQRQVPAEQDLALNTPGQAARKQAMELRAAAPVRTFFQRAVGAKTDERSWRIGADGEQDIARRLAKLGPDWKVLHAVPVGVRGSDIDHVVIGPAGVFTINAKNHPQARVWIGGDTVLVNGAHQPYVRNSRHEASRAAALLSAATGERVDVRGIVALVGADRGLTVKEQPRDGLVAVLSRKQLLSHLRELSVQLDEAAVARIYEAARQARTWQPRTVGRIAS